MKIINKETLAELKKVLAEHDDFLILTHVNPDGDALGSQLALGRSLEETGKKVTMLLDDEVPAMYRFLSDIKQIKRYQPGMELKASACFVLDCVSLERTGSIAASLADLVKINVDHHPGQPADMDIIIRDEQSPATATIIYELLRALNITIDATSAYLLYAGLATDTGFFKYHNTTPYAHKVAAELIELGAEPVSLAQSIFENESLNRLKLLSAALSTLVYDEKAKVATMKVTARMYEATDTRASDTQEFVNYPKSIQDAEVGLFLREEPDNTVKASLRSKGLVDVNKVAAAFSGGGHKNASGCTLKAGIEEAKEKIIAEVLKQLSNR